MYNAQIKFYKPKVKIYNSCIINYQIYNFLKLV
jgi:hypothetical protein